MTARNPPSAKRLTAAFRKTVAALLPLTAEERRRVIAAVHALIEIGTGASRQAQGPGPESAGRASRRGRA